MKRSWRFAVLVVPTMVACRSPDQNVTTQPAAGHVNMTLTCFPDGSLGFSLAPWRVTLPNEHAAFTWHNDHSSNANGVITAQNPQFPFGTETFTANAGGNAVGKPIKDTPAAKYKYSVTVICPLPDGKADTTVVDPDMIIPWKIT
jgi:hypothetical protein